MSTPRTILRIGSVMTGVGLAVIATAVPASAHVTANTTAAVQGSSSKVTFRVPNEDATAGTVRVQVTLPTTTPVPGASIRPVPGWRASIETATLDKAVRENNVDVVKAVKTITWTAEPGVRIGPGEFQEFDVSLESLPDDTNKLILPAVQTYDSGRVVSWSDQPPSDGQPEPEHPAPVITLQPKQDDSDGMSTSDSGAITTTARAGADTVARWLGGAGLVVGALGLGFGGGSVLRNRKPSASSGNGRGKTT
ncbi:MAG: YcnI family protein [Kutzneria sp.]|nr:YcnI family protein [Kutzneria sp.]MBV9845649.1 YcnI family protein [Kutzneria sp.]